MLKFFVLFQKQSTTKVQSALGIFENLKFVVCLQKKSKLPPTYPQSFNFNFVLWKSLMDSPLYSPRSSRSR